MQFCHAFQVVSMFPSHFYKTPDEFLFESKCADLGVQRWIVAKYAVTQKCDNLKHGRPECWEASSLLIKKSLTPKTGPVLQKTTLSQLHLVVSKQMVLFYLLRFLPHPNILICPVTVSCLHQIIHSDLTVNTSYRRSSLYKNCWQWSLWTPQTKSYSPPLYWCGDSDSETYPWDKLDTWN